MCCKLIEHFRAQWPALCRTMNVPFTPSKTMFIYFPSYTGEHWVFPHPTSWHLMRTEVISGMSMSAHLQLHIHVHETAEYELTYYVCMYLYARIKIRPRTTRSLTLCLLFVVLSRALIPSQWLGLPGIPTRTTQKMVVAPHSTQIQRVRTRVGYTLSYPHANYVCKCRVMDPAYLIKASEHTRPPPTKYTHTYTHLHTSRQPLQQTHT